MSAFYKSFDVKKVLASGLLEILPGETVDVTNITAGGSLGSLTSDGDGFIVTGSLSASVGDVAEFSVSGYPNVVRQYLGATALDAFEDARNSVMTFIVEDVSTAAFADKLDYYLVDLDDDKKAPELIASGKSTETARVPYQTTVTKNLRIIPVSRDINNKQSAADLNLVAGYQDITIDPPTAPFSNTLLFDNYTDAPTTGTALETLYSDVVDGDTFTASGDLIDITYHGVTAANGNSKQILFEYDGNTLTAPTTTANNKAWELNISLQRSGIDELRYGVEFTITGDSPTLGGGALTGLDFSLDADADLLAHTATALGDVTALKNDAKFWKSSGAPILTFLGNPIAFNGKSLTFGA